MLNVGLNTRRQESGDRRRIHLMDIMKLISRIYCWVLLIVLSSCSVKKNIQTTTFTPTITPTIKVNPYNAEILINDSALATAHMGIALYDADNNSYLYQYQSNKYFIPASNTKIMTCYAAMKYLGDSLEGLKYSYNNFGGISFTGTGDPTFLHPSFKNQRVYNFLKDGGNTQYILDNKRVQFKPFGKGWTNDDYYEDYMNELSEFPIYGNDRNFYSQLDTSIVFKYSTPAIKNVYAGSVGLRTSAIDTTLKTNAQLPYFLKLLKDTLQNNTFNFSSVSSHNFTSTIHSQPTDSVLQYMMYNSDNFFAEQLLLMVSNKQLGVMNDTRMFDTLLAADFNLFPQKPKWADACGLSRYNLFTPEDIVYVLGKIKTSFKEERINAIFPAGNQGTLKGYYINNSQLIHAKTGSMSGVFCISGYITTSHNKHLIFSVMVNNHQVKGENLRRKIEGYLMKIMED